MGKVVRSIVAVIVGFVAASAGMMLIETVNHHVLHPELGKLAEGMTDKEAIRALLATAPVAHALILGGLLTLAGIANNLMLPPPGWFSILSLVVLLPAAYAGARLAPRKNQAKT